MAFFEVKVCDFLEEKSDSKCPLDGIFIEFVILAFSDQTYELAGLLKLH